MPASSPSPGNSSKDPRVDEYIAQAAPFAQPILEHLRKLIHKAAPGVQETIKWSHPIFEIHGSILCNMQAYKQHCSFGFWKASLIKLSEPAFDRITTKKDLPADKIIVDYIKEAAALNKKGVKVVREKKAPVTLATPPQLEAALKKNKAALATWGAFAPSHKKEYIQWIMEAKTDETRDKRIATTIEWVTQGKGRNWKYQQKK